ncbi:MAG: alpha/beta hydrolase [Anaerolineales bacterium]
MSRGIKITLIVVLVLVLVIFVGINILTYSTAKDILTLTMQDRIDEGLWPPEKTPEDYGRSYEEVSTMSPDGLKLTGWYLAGVNGATVMILHGSPGGRQDGLYEAAFLNEAGYNVLLGSFRSHDDSEGERITFGFYEIQDAEAWHKYLLSREDVDPDRIGIYGESMGGGTGLLYAARQPGIRAIATGSAFGLTREVVELFMGFETDLPQWAIPLLSRFIIFWAERIGDMDSQALDTQAVIADISPVPVLIIHGGKDDKIGPNIGRELFEAAAQPKQLLWIEDAGHVNFEEFEPELYRETLIKFFEENLLN